MRIFFTTPILLLAVNAATVKQICLAPGLDCQSLESPLSKLTGIDDSQQPLSLFKDGSHSALSFLDPFAELHNALEVMQNTWFQLEGGTWPTGIDWTRAVLDTHLIATAATLSRSVQPDSDVEEVLRLENLVNRYFIQNVAYYFGENARALRKQAYDDMLWLVLGWLESIKFIESQSRLLERPFIDEAWYGQQFVPVFANRAHEFWEITTEGWDTKFCDGGMVWNPKLGPYKNAITNELFITGSIGMYLYHPGNSTSSVVPRSTESEVASTAGRYASRHLDAAVRGYDWLKNVGMTNKKGLYVDGFHIKDWQKDGRKCDQRNEMVYTYNQGVLLSGLRGLWEATGNSSYLEDGHKLARDSIRATNWDLESGTAANDGKWAGLGRGGLLEDACDSHGRCNQDGQTFKGIFMHHLTLLCEPLPSVAKHPGKTFGASEELSYLHYQSCKEYLPWVELNAKAALDTRDVHGKFGVWWGAREGVVPALLPLNAVDYRNSPSSPQKGSAEGVDMWDDTPGLPGPITEDEVSASSDLNDRGRGRTVETQSGGVAVLRALWELQHLD